MPFQVPITIANALERVRKHEFVLPAIQREFVWSTDQIARLFDSLMRGYPIGSFLFWKVDKEHSKEFVFYDFMQNYHQLRRTHLEKSDLDDEQAGDGDLGWVAAADGAEYWPPRESRGEDS